MREIQFHSLLRSKELEIQYHLAQQERLRKQQDAELNKSHQLTRQVSTFSQTENELRSQLNIYVEKFKQVRLFSKHAALVHVFVPLSQRAPARLYYHQYSRNRSTTNFLPVSNLDSAISLTDRISRSKTPLTTATTCS